MQSVGRGVVLTRSEASVVGGASVTHPGEGRHAPGSSEVHQEIVVMGPAGSPAQLLVPVGTTYRGDLALPGGQLGLVGGAHPDLPLGGGQAPRLRVVTQSVEESVVCRVELFD